MNRRGLLKKTLGGAALLAVAGAVPLALRKTRLRPPRGPLQFFSEAEYSVWAAVAERILAREPTPASREPGDFPSAAATEVAERRAPPPSAAEVDVAAKADAFLAPLPPGDARDLKQLLALFDNALFSLLTGGPPTPFTQMSPEQQDAHLRAWQQSRLAVRRTGYQALKRLTCAIYFGSPAVYASLGYPGPPVELVKSVLGARK